MEAEGGLISSLTMAQSGMLFGVSKQKFVLKAGFVKAEDVFGRLRQVGGNEQAGHFFAAPDGDHEANLLESLHPNEL